MRLDVIFPRNGNSRNKFIWIYLWRVCETKYQNAEDDLSFIAFVTNWTISLCSNFCKKVDLMITMIPFLVSHVKLIKVALMDSWMLSKYFPLINKKSASRINKLDQVSFKISNYRHIHRGQSNCRSMRLWCYFCAWTQLGLIKQSLNPELASSWKIASDLILRRNFPKHFYRTL